MNINGLNWQNEYVEWIKKSVFETELLYTYLKCADVFHVRTQITLPSSFFIVDNFFRETLPLISI